MKKYIVELTPEEVRQLQELVTQGKTAARRILHAHILLQANAAEGGPAWKDEAIAEAFGVSVRSVERIRQRCVENGLDDALERRKSATGICRRKLDGKGEAYLCKLACSKPPQGRERWTIRLLRDQLVELRIVEDIGRETVRTTLKKNEIKPWLRMEWCIPPQEDAAFVCAMEEVLDVYESPGDPEEPVVAMDETTKQLTREVIDPLPPVPGQPERYETLYQRHGVAVLFLFFDALRGWRGRSRRPSSPCSRKRWSHL